ncbi:phosphotransferase [Brevibacterium otitidis]|uniref:Phosphotransferase n=1 Tax=Brevibacterium otitidis TaxID=53364 RepID=A0ABV5X438_9MICO
MGLRLAAIAAGEITGFEPTLWTQLSDSRGSRVLLSSEDRSLVVSLIPETEVPAAQTEAVAGAVLRSLLPDSPIGFPQIVATTPAPDDLTQDGVPYEVQISDPLRGTPATLADFEDSADAVASLADFLADLHNSDTGAVADAGLVVHDSAELREQLLADLDRAAGTGLVPTVLLQRWEDALENVSTWRFLPCPIHAALAPEAIRIDAGQVASVSDFFRFRVGDPAADLAAVSTFVSGEQYDAFLARYRQQRKIKDAGLQARAELLAELAVLDWLLLAVDTEDDAAKADAVELLRSLADVATAEVQEPRHAQPFEFTDRQPADASEAGAADEPDAAGEPAEPTDAAGPDDVRAASDDGADADDPSEVSDVSAEVAAAAADDADPETDVDEADHTDAVWQPAVRPHVRGGSHGDNTFRPAAAPAPFDESAAADAPTQRIMDFDDDDISNYDTERISGPDADGQQNS